MNNNNNNKHFEFTDETINLEGVDNKCPACQSENRHSVCTYNTGLVKFTEYVCEDCGVEYQETIQYF